MIMSVDRAEEGFPVRTADPLGYAHQALRELTTIAPRDPARGRLRDTIICQCLPVARREARRYQYTSESVEDLFQVATIGLIHAVDRFDVARGVHFSAFAIPTITGELRRHLRDTTWSMHVPRRLQELSLSLTRAERELTQRLARTATDAEIARHLEVAEGDVRAARAARAVHRIQSLNAPAGTRGQEQVGDQVGGRDARLEAAAELLTLREALLELPRDYQELIVLRFVESLTQTEIAARTGMTQVQVSRLLNKVLSLVRRRITGTTAEPRQRVPTRQRKETPLSAGATGSVRCG